VNDLFEEIAMTAIQSVQWHFQLQPLFRAVETGNIRFMWFVHPHRMAAPGLTHAILIAVSNAVGGVGAKPKDLARYGEHNRIPTDIWLISNQQYCESLSRSEKDQ
jgi:hypothetical protein